MAISIDNLELYCDFSKVSTICSRVSSQGRPRFSQ